MAEQGALPRSSSGVTNSTQVAPWAESPFLWSCSIYLFLKETGWVGSFHLITCSLIVRILSKRSTYVYINISHVRNVVEIWLPTVSIQKLGSHSKNFSQKKFLSSLFKNKRSHEKQLIQKLMFQCWLHSQHTFFPWSKGESAIPLNRQTAEG